MGKKPDLPKGGFRFRFLCVLFTSSKQRKSISRHYSSGAEAVASVDVAGLYGNETVVADKLKRIAENPQKQAYDDTPCGLYHFCYIFGLQYA